VPHRQRPHPAQQRAHRGAHDEAHQDTGNHPEHPDLGAQQQRAQREAARCHPERHPDADLPALRVDDPSDQVERGEHRSDQDEDGQHIPQSLIAVDGVVKDLPGLDVVPVGHRHARAGQCCGQGLGQLGGERAGVRARSQGEHQVVDGAELSGEPLRGR
jgi:hypothetical protein